MSEREHMVIQGLEEKKDACTSAVLHEAADGGHEETLTLLPSSGAPATSKGSNGITPLMRASRRGHLDRVQKLLQSLGDEELEERDVNGKTALYHAAAGGREGVVASLLSHGAQANCKNGHGTTPLMRASLRGHLCVVQTLLQVVGEQGLEERDVNGRTALYHAAAEGLEKVVALLLSRGVQPHSAGDNGVTPLMAACSRGHMDVVHLLLQHVGEQGLEERSKKGWTALQYAATGGHEKVVAALLSHGARANSKDGKGKTPLMTAATKGHLGVVETLLQVVGEQGLEARDVVGWTALHYAADCGHKEVVACLLNKGAQANSKDGEGVTPLMQASLQGYLGVVQQLLQVVGEQGLEGRDKDGWTALLYAADRGHKEVVKLLLSHGAQANSKDDGGATPLMQASLQGYLCVVQQLLQVVGEQGLEEQDKNCWTALLYAVDGDHAEVVKLLLSHGAQTDSKDGESLTALMHASFRGQLCVAQTLVEVGGNQGLADRDGDGSTALHYAAAAGHVEVAAFLLSKGAQPNSKDGKGVTPLMYASWEGQLCVVQMLVEVGGNPGLEEEDQDGRTALHHAAEGGHAEVMSWLLSQGAQANRKDRQGKTPLMVASWGGHLGGVLKLHEVMGNQGLADTDEDGWTVLHHAVDGGHDEVVVFLLSRGAQANSKDEGDMTPLMHASSQGHLGVAQKLVEVVGEQGLEERDVNGWTALHFAADGGHKDVVIFLLSTGAEVQSSDSEGNTPLMLACMNHYLGVVRALLPHTHVQGLNERDADGRTALHLACVTGFAEHAEVAKDIVRALLLAGANPTVVNDEGRTPRAFAEADGYTEVVPMFEWWEAELERPYLLHRAKCIFDVYMRQQVAPPVPAFLKPRTFPRVEVVALQQEPEGTVGRKASAEARGTQEGEDERHAMVTYAMKEMNEQLYIELLEGFHG